MNGSDECCLPQPRPPILSGSANKNQQQGVYKHGRNPVSSICNEISALNPNHNFEKKNPTKPADQEAVKQIFLLAVIYK